MKRRIVLIMAITTFVFLMGILFFRNRPIAKRVESSRPLKIELANRSLDSEKMWRNHFEDKLLESDDTVKMQLDKIKDAFRIESEEIRTQNKTDISDLKEQLLLARNDLRTALNEIIEMKNNAQDEPNKNEPIPPHVSLIEISDDPNISEPKDSKIYIPETSYVTGFLLGGIAVSTSVGSASEPVPVVIRITDRGNLPQNLSVDIKECRILGSSYGDLSSERAVIRAEAMICQNSSEEVVITTKVAGIVYGDDGMNGIKGRVVDMSGKHIRNAAIGGMLSGFSNTMKSEGEMMLSPFGNARIKGQTAHEKLRNNSLAGMGSAAEKIADYYIKQAENMSPILLIPGGTKVDVIFTKGVYLGSVDVAKRIQNEVK